MYGGFLASSSLLWPEGWQTNARTGSVGWSLCTVPQIKQMNLTVQHARFHGVGICLWQTQLVWIRLGTDRQRLRANTTSVPTPSVIGFCFTSLVFFYFLLSFTFSSDGFIVTTVAASISGDIVYSISNIKWMHGWMDSYSYRGGFLLHRPCYLISGISLTHPMQVYVGIFSNSMPCVLSCEEFLLYSPCCFMWVVSLTILPAMY